MILPHSALPPWKDLSLWHTTSIFMPTTTLLVFSCVLFHYAPIAYFMCLCVV